MDEKLKEFIEKQKEVVISSYEQAKSYSNIIMMGGYVGLFAIWNFTKDNLNKWQSMSVGLLATVSVFTFVLFEVYGLWFRSRQTFSLMSELDKAERLNEFPADYGKQEIKCSKRMMKAWPFFFFITLCSGVSAGVILVWSFVTK
ncbi:MAG: hypothetical protein KAS87_05930, partial [Candidatus Omnitrophica bacterium]|nr:hypothetical protein [Candidatus Omnitrophota bacterium]